MSDKDYNIFDRVHTRWPASEDKLLLPNNRTVFPADIGERNYRLLQGYKRAGDVLIQNSYNDPTDHKNLLYPILFCYRHYIEISMKYLIDEYGYIAGITYKKTHKLIDLWNDFVIVLEHYYNKDALNETIDIVKCSIVDLSSIDEYSFSFRYSTDKKRDKIISLPGDGVDLFNLHDVMNSIENFFECVDLDLQARSDYSDYVVDDI